METKDAAALLFQQKQKQLKRNSIELILFMPNSDLGWGSLEGWLHSTKVRQSHPHLGVTIESTVC
jgi:hypothetical protein